jgi:hypothetical protein
MQSVDEKLIANGGPAVPPSSRQQGRVQEAATPVKAPDVGASLGRLPLVGLNRAQAGIRAATRAFRRQVEAELLATGGGGIASASKVHTAAVAFRRHLEAEKRKTDANGSLTLEARLALSDRSLLWKVACDRALDAIGLQARKAPADPWDSIYNPPAAPAGAGRDGTAANSRDHSPTPGEAPEATAQQETATPET